MTAVTFEAVGEDEKARTGRLHTPHGVVATPAFMPVGTRGTVRNVGVDDLADVGAQMVLANTYHLMLRPGAGVVAGLGGLHGFSGWRGPMLTDSGGYQVFSLDPKLDEEGVTFSSTYDGSTVRLTPEDAVAVQQELGADIAMVLDQLVGLPAPRGVVRDSMERTLRWSERARAVHDRSDQELFGIIQGGVDAELRAESARRTAEIGFAGFGIGGLSVGESAQERGVALDATVPELPVDAVRYVMGLGDTAGVLDAIARGCDLFDCVWPTRLARHGKVLSRFGDYSIRRAEFAADPSPIDPECECFTCLTHSRGYLRHLRVTDEMLVHRLLSVHNLSYTFGVLRRAREAIVAGRFVEFRADVATLRTSGPPR